jgi:hypothetical protein
VALRLRLRLASTAARGEAVLASHTPAGDAPTNSGYVARCFTERDRQIVEAVARFGV